MSQVYFDPAVGGDGSTVSDDSNAGTGLANGGHRTRFIPALSQIVAIASWMLGKVSAAAGSASSAASSADLSAGYAATVGSTTAGNDPVQSPANYMLGSAAYINQTFLYASATYDPPSLAAGTSTTTTVAVAGAELGDFVQTSANITMTLIVTGRVSAADTVTLTYVNPTAGAVDIGSHTAYVEVKKRIPT